LDAHVARSLTYCTNTLNFSAAGPRFTSPDPQVHRVPLSTVSEALAYIICRMSYCKIAPDHPQHGPYHDREYGFPVSNEAALFERLVLEINQAGLSWLTILNKRVNFRTAYDNFDVDRVARYGERERKRLLEDEGIVRNRLKIDAAIENARRIRALRDNHGSFAAWLAGNHPRSKIEWVKLFKQTFRFTGGEITGEFLISIGYLPGAHDETCPVYAKIARRKPPWMAPQDRKVTVSVR
jgi:DNA-3-methyladenine glycosylase I